MATDYRRIYAINLAEMSVHICRMLYDFNAILPYLGSTGNTRRSLSHVSSSQFLKHAMRDINGTTAFHISNCCQGRAGMGRANILYAWCFYVTKCMYVLMLGNTLLSSI